MKSRKVLTEIERNQFIAVYRTTDKQKFIDIAQILIENGLKTIEVTATTPHSNEIIRELSQYKHAVVGAGTILDSESAKSAIEAGASFIVSPGFDKNSAKIANSYDVPYIPGCMTVTEMMNASQYGCNIIKLFPANQYNSKAIKDFQGPLPQLDFIPTGGIGIANAKDWLDSGSFAMGIGSEITKIYDKEGSNGLSKYVRELLMQK
ncbi:bifunctional 4-hydroxy-2-oxoglutarate aldolase/2-dehydro-3-deoxy-phosphogluconate aldolase [Staphylococcus sp. ACRSN]|uniref:bifunctional 4-hydroxy-2-oxoglutarate aldolase/2-dehydro-3-deoxy-phosphogluconate aldolase n=1 Tax=Staphylococcus sp. ACRSN TaxID=2918214 RepID=UPI001EF3987D|nr:bifunctional 4-hydroxy-2-oxoglutarate aldolase/2-dehydro-3-deoxy-phosphogluconate aldolase [Staphylococcus sp. ACRSN]MCG7338900.1 bifunctional 4-hydroxy-2-oxoglutarate aldolase/2-dehydro-3-deoxy-phosphogluconate aldolase [Staphylococcus sp. ACRSN]